MEKYELLSLENHLYFARIMKEHAFFLEAGFQGKNVSYIRRAEWFKLAFEQILSQAVALGSGMVRDCVLDSGELFTQYTLRAEEQSSCLTGIGLNTTITARQKKMLRGYGGGGCGFSNQVERLNQQALRLVENLIEFKEEILREVKNCSLYTANYPLLIEHITREARLYRCMIRKLMGYDDDGCCDVACTEVFWNRIMMEHALFIRGLLDPTEEELICAAHDFAQEFKALLAEAKEKDDCAAEMMGCGGQMMDRETEMMDREAGEKGCHAESLTERTKMATMRLRDFKEAGTKGISECQISSLILPLLADHVLREANHYLRLLEGCYGTV